MNTIQKENTNTIQKVTVANMTGNSGREVPNQFEITTKEGIYFQSYDSIIAFVPRYSFRFENDKEAIKTVLDKNYWDYSTTTGKYRNIFLGEKKPETERKIKSGEYILADLNS